MLCVIYSESPNTCTYKIQTILHGMGLCPWLAAENVWGAALGAVPAPNLFINPELDWKNLSHRFKQTLEQTIVLYYV